MTAYLTTAVKNTLLAQVRSAQDRANLTLAMTTFAAALAHDMTEAGVVTQQAHIANMVVVNNPVASVPGSFADLPAVRTYLAGATVMPGIEARLAALEAKMNALLLALETANVLASA
jgi:hypothetical protein